MVNLVNTLYIYILYIYIPSYHISPLYQQITPGTTSHYKSPLYHHHENPIALFWNPVSRREFFAPEILSQPARQRKRYLSSGSCKAARCLAAAWCYEIGVTIVRLWDPVQHGSIWVYATMHADSCIFHPFLASCNSSPLYNVGPPSYKLV